MRYTWLVEKYLEGELSGEALRKFELEILRKPEVAEEVERIRSLTAFTREQHLKLHDYHGLIEDFDDLENIIDEQDIQQEFEGLKIKKISSSSSNFKEIGNKLSEFHAEDKLRRLNNNKILVKKVSIWLAGSAMAILIAVSSLLLIGSIPPDYLKLYGEYYSPRDVDVQRSNNTDQDDIYAQAMKSYKAKNYFMAYHFFYLLPESEASNESLLCRGITSMELGNYLEAIEIFNSLEDKDLIFKHEAMWYKSLCFLATGNEKATYYALEEIVNNNGYHKTNALSLMRKL